MERTVDTYTYNHHSLEKCGHIVPDVQSTPPASLQTGPHITVRLLIVISMETEAPEVASDHKDQESLDFDAKLFFVSSNAGEYHEL